MSMGRSWLRLRSSSSWLTVDQARQEAAARLAGKLQRPCHDCEQRETTCVCNECNEYGSCGVAVPARVSNP